MGYTHLKCASSLIRALMEGRSGESEARLDVSLPV